VTRPESSRLAGSVRWAVVPYSPRPPFRLYAGEQHAPIVVGSADEIIAAARKRGADAELTYLVPGKARPVLILSEPPTAYHQEVTALRLLRLAKLDQEEQDEVRRQADELLFYLSPERFQLPEENAAMVSAVVRLHLDAVESGPSLGVLDDEEMRTLGERIIRFYQFDTRRLLEARIRELAARRPGGPRLGVDA